MRPSREVLAFVLTAAFAIAALLHCSTSSTTSNSATDAGTEDGGDLSSDSGARATCIEDASDCRSPCAIQEGWPVLDGATCNGARPLYCARRLGSGNAIVECISKPSEGRVFWVPQRTTEYPAGYGACSAEERNQPLVDSGMPCP